jgi:hypothetical protein
MLVVAVFVMRVFGVQSTRGWALVPSWIVLGAGAIVGITA